MARPEQDLSEHDIGQGETGSNSTARSISSSASCSRPVGTKWRATRIGTWRGRSQLPRPGEVPVGAIPVEIDPGPISPGEAVGFAQGIVELECPRGPPAPRPPADGQAGSDAYRRVRPGPRRAAGKRIDRDRPLEVRPALRERLQGLVQLVVVVAALQPQAVRLQVAARRTAGAGSSRTSRARAIALAISSWTRKHLPVHGQRSRSKDGSRLASTSCAETRTRPPDRWTLPSSRALPPTSLRSPVRPGPCRGRRTRRCGQSSAIRGTRVRSVMTSSAKPSLKYSFSFSALRLANGSTAIAGARECGADGPRLPPGARGRLNQPSSSALSAYTPAYRLPGPGAPEGP